jgi:hypothetical protein
VEAEEELLFIKDPPQVDPDVCKSCTGWEMVKAEGIKSETTLIKHVCARLNSHDTSEAAIVLEWNGFQPIKYGCGTFTRQVPAIKNKASKAAA